MARAIVILLFFVPVMALAADDPIKAELDKARAKHTEDLDAAKTNLVAALDVKLREVAGKGDLDNAKEIKEQKELFEMEGTLPKSPMLARANRDYESGVRAAKRAMRKALEKAKGDYTKAVKLDQAEAMAAELKEFADALPVKKGTGSAVQGAEPTIVATWVHQIGNGKEALRSTFKLYSNGKINSPEARDTWVIKNGLIILTWPNADAPGGAWKDVCNLSSDGKSYSGKNNKGTPIYGVKIASGDADEEKKKK
jgi:hypothetical protein